MWALMTDRKSWPSIRMIDLEGFWPKYWNNVLGPAVD